MLHNCRDKAIEDFVSAFETSKKMYRERLEKERTRLREKKGIRGKALEDEVNNRIRFFDMKFKSKKKNWQSLSTSDTKTGMHQLGSFHG